MTAATGETTYTVRAGEADTATRLDRLLSAALPDLSRTRIKTLIESGRVAAAGQTIADPSYRVKPGQTFAVFVPESAPARPRPWARALDILHEDADLIVVNKPAGMVVHPAAGNQEFTLVNALLAHCGDTLSGVGGVRRPGIVHRLDKDTSGLMVVAKNDAAHAGLAAQFAERSVERAYTAVVLGVPQSVEGEIAGNIARSPTHRKRMAVVARGGKPAVTRYRVERVLGGGVASVLTCRLATGRTHQIRVHLAASGHPVIGDPLYGRVRGPRLRRLPPRAAAALKGFRRQALHAHLIGFVHPTTRKRLRFEAPLPLDIKGLIDSLEAI